jgi:ribonuclease HI
VSAPPTVVYTDGACKGNPGRGGWAWAVPNGPYETGAEANTTNQRMEIQAVLEAVTSLDGPLVVMSDSTYVVNCFRDRWWEGWLARDWKNSARKPVANRDLWEPLVDAYRADPRRLQFRWVKGHSSDPMNEIVDRLAVEAAARQVGRKGRATPGGFGPTDSANMPRPDGRVLAGHLVVVTGLKPPDLGGYDNNPLAERLLDRLTEILVAKKELQPDLTVLSGLGLGAEQLGAEAALEAGVPYIAVLAFPGIDEMWPAASRDRFAKLLAGATSTLTLQQNKPRSRQAAGGALARRDAWLARNSDEAIAVWDGHNPAVGRVVRSLQDHLGETEVWIVEPQ